MKKNKKYTARYLYDFLVAIPDRMWTTQMFITENGQCCAQGHCGSRYRKKTRMGKALCSLAIKLQVHVIYVNDDECSNPCVKFITTPSKARDHAPESSTCYAKRKEWGFDIHNQLLQTN